MEWPICQVIKTWSVCAVRGVPVLEHIGTTRTCVTKNNDKKPGRRGKGKWILNVTFSVQKCHCMLQRSKASIQGYESRVKVGEG